MSEVDPLPPPPVPLRRLHPNVRTTWLIDTGIGSLLLFAVLAGLDVLLLRRWEPWPLPPMATTGIIMALWVILMWRWNVKRYACWGYALRDFDLVIENGVWWKTRRCIPRSRVQHVDISSGPIDRSLGLVNVELYVAGAMGAVAEIHGLDPYDAEGLRAALLDREGARGRDTDAV